MAIGEMCQTTHIAPDCASDGVREVYFSSRPSTLPVGSPNTRVTKWIATRGYPVRVVGQRFRVQPR